MHTSQLIFSPPIRWTLGVLSWLAFGVSAYLALHAIGSASVAGCGVGGHNGCDVVLSSAWSKWIVIPVAVLGLACYATLAGLSVMLAFQFTANRWITTAYILLATLAAGASLWFIGLQVFAIGDFCLFCLATDICGVAIGAIAAWSAFRWWSGKPHLRTTGNSSTTLSALRSAIPSSTRLAPVATTRTAPPAGAAETTPAVSRSQATTTARSVPLVGSVGSPAALRTYAPPPSMRIAYGGALALLIVLIGGQIVFPAKTFNDEQLALNKQLDLSAENGSDKNGKTPDGAEAHVTKRIPPDGETEPADQKPDSSAATQVNGNGASTNADPADQDIAAAPPAAPKRERIIKLLGGKLTLDVGDEPIIGSANAPHVVVEMVSYNCSHCRKMNRLMKRALSRYGDQVALVVLALPLEAKCNRMVTNPAASHAGACTTARTAIALAKLKPSSFPPFHDFLMSGDKDEPPALTTILLKAFTMADREKLQATRDSPEVGKKIASYVDLYAALQQQSSKKKEFGLPIQILGDHVTSGSIEKADDLFKAWEEHLGIKPR